MNRKPRADSILDSNALTDAQREELRAMLMSGYSHAQCIAWLSASCGVEVKSKDTLTTFWRRHCAPIVDANRRLATVKSEDYMNGADTDWDTPTTRLMKQTSFEILSGQSVDPKTADVYIKNLLKLREQEANAKRQEAALKTKEDAGIDALMDAAKGDKIAEDLIRKFHARLKEIGKA
jgi:hypothetical protein